MLVTHVRAPITSEAIHVMRSLAETARRLDGRVTLDDETWRDLAHPPEGSAIVVASRDDEPIAAAHVSPAEGAGVPGARTGRFDIELVVPTPDADAVETLLDAALRYVHQVGGTRLQLWAIGATAEDDTRAAVNSFSVERELWQMRVPLPLAEGPRWPDGIQVRHFEPGRDEAAWLAVNNRTFAADPDQGGWSDTELQRREAEPWFDPSGFLLAGAAPAIPNPDPDFSNPDIWGFCWTKIHPAAPPSEPESLGEIYVIGVDPDHRGTGLGRALVVAGLASLYARGPSVGMLYVDAANRSAVGLYRALGFHVTRVDRAYVRGVA